MCKERSAWTRSWPVLEQLALSWVRWIESWIIRRNIIRHCQQQQQQQPARARERERLLFVSLTSSSIHKKKNNSNNKESEIPTPSIVLSVCENTNVDGVQVFAGLSPASPPSSSSALITYKSMGNIPSFTSRKERKPLFFPSARSLIPITSI